MGAYFLLGSSGDPDDNSLDFGPKIGVGNLIMFDPNERKTVINVTEETEKYLKRKNVK